MYSRKSRIERLASGMSQYLTGIFGVTIFIHSISRPALRSVMSRVYASAASPSKGTIRRIKGPDYTILRKVRKCMRSL
jgi:hypothetical protein